MLKPQLAAAFAVETKYQAQTDPVLMIDERRRATTISPGAVITHLTGGSVAGAPSPAPDTASMVVGWECLRHVFRPQSALDQIGDRLTSGGRLIYAQRLVDQYLGLTAKWLLDYFITAQYADCRVYILWRSEPAPAVATFDYAWMLAHAAPVYNPMWDNITHAEAVVVVAQKGADSRPASPPSQDIYRPADEWELYAAALARLAGSSRPWHLRGPAPDRLPSGYQPCAGETAREGSTAFL